MRRPFATAALLLATQCSLLTDFSGVNDGEQEAGSDASSCDAAGTTADYQVHALPPGANPSIDGVCDEPFWATLPSVPFSGQKDSDNLGTCRLAWADGSPPLQYGCCQIEDSDLRANVTAPDGDVHEDDSVEVISKGNTKREFDQTTTKVFFNLRQTVKDVDFEPTVFDESYDSQATVGVGLDGTLDPGDTDGGYTVEWRARLGFQVTPPQLGLCGFMINDRDGGDGGAQKTTWTAFGQLINDPEHWGTCAFTCGLP